MFCRKIPASLPAWEQGVYWIAELAAIIYMIWSLYQASEDAWRRNEHIRLEDGWTVIGRPRDAADSEWEFWSSFFWVALPWLCGHTILSFILTTFINYPKTRYILLTCYSVFAISILLGFYTLLFMCIQPVILYLVSKLKSSKAVWLTTLIFLTILNYFEAAVVHGLDIYRTSVDFRSWYYLCVFVWANMCQRATAFALECVWVLQSNTAICLGENKICKNSEIVPDPLGWPTLTETPDLVDLFFYMFYFPAFFTGPLMVYNNFHRQTREPLPCSRIRLLDIAQKFVRILFWAIINTVVLHYVYAHAINMNSKILARQTRWTLAAIGYVLGQFFMMKYLVLFGFPAQVARLDGFEPPAVPACISYIYCYSDMWKSFDRGLYDFMKRYIFIPFGGSQAGFVRQVLSSVFCFAYVFYWHGAEYYLFLWCVLNFAEITLEQVGAWLEKTVIIRTYLYDALSPGGIRRVRAVMSVPVFLMSVFAIFYFFGGTDAGVIFLQKLLLDIPWDSFCLFLLLVYCAVQNAMEVERLQWTKLKVPTHKN